MEMDYGQFVIEYENCYQDIVHVLIRNGYEVTIVLVEDDNKIKINFKRGIPQ